MRQIVRIKFGSHLYGTNTPESDEDYKAVYVPCARDIVLQRVKGSVSTQRPKAEGEKNVAGEIDEESYSLQKFLKLASEGQTVALDVLFAPIWAMPVYPAPEWLEIIQNRHRLITRKSAAFIGYCRQQANKYGIKGSRVAASKAALAMLTEGLEKHGTTAKLEVMAAEAEALAGQNEHMAIIDMDNHGRVVRHLDVCNRKMPWPSSIKSAREIMQRLVDEYGHRARLAERNEGVDWKALSHAVRVGRQALELLETGNVTFPLPYAAHILKIKRGEAPYQAVAEEIEELLAKVESASERSSLPVEADTKWVDDFVAAVYTRTVKDGEAASY